MRSVLRSAIPTLLGVFAVLAGCAPYRQDLTDPNPSAWSRLSTGAVPAILPADSPVKAVAARTRTHASSYRSYRAVLSNGTTLPGENRLSIDVEYTPRHFLEFVDPPPRLFPIPLYTAETLTATLESEFPDLAAEQAHAPRRNRYGLYDYAVAHRGRDSCVLAWQLLDDRKRMLPDTLRAIRLEWRVCGTNTEPAALLAPFDQLKLTVDPDILIKESF